MTDTVRTESYLLTAFADNSTGAITAQQLRDFVKTSFEGLTPYAPLAGATFTGDLAFSGVTHAGLIPNSMTTAQMNAISSPVNGSLLFTTDSARLQYCVNGTFQQLAGRASESFSGLTTFSTTGIALSTDAFLSYKATANLQLGAADAASPVAQLLSVQSVVAGTSNTAGTNFTFNGSRGTGNAAGGSLIFNITLTGTSGTSQNSLQNALVLSANSNRTLATVSDFDAGGSTIHVATSTGVFSLYNAGQLGWTNGATASGGIVDTILTRKGAANVQLGATDAAAPVAQTVSVQNVVAGTTNTAGVSLTIAGSQGTGTGAGGSILFKTAPAGTTGTAQNALSTVLTLDSTLLAAFAGNITVPANGTIGVSAGSNIQYAGSTLTYTTTSNNNPTAHVFVGNNQSASNGSLHENIKHTCTFNPSSGASPFAGMSLAYTINQTGSASGGYTALKVNVTETAVLGSSKLLMDLQVGGTSKFSVTSVGSVVLTNSLTIGAGNGFQWSGRTLVTSPADGNVRMINSAGTGFGLLQLGGTTSSFPSLKQSSAVLQTRLADDSAFGQIQGKITTDTNATTGLSAGALSATTNASIVLYDGSGQAYRVPCII